MKLLADIRRSVQLLRRSLIVIRENPRLLIFPLIIGVFTAVIALFFIVPVVFMPTGYHVTQGEHWQALSHKLFTSPPAGGAAPGSSQLGFQPWLAGYLAVIYLVSMFAATFCNVAFTAEVLAALNGDGVSLRRGLGVARSRLKSIVVWSLFAGLVGLLIQQIEARLSFVGRLIAGLIGLAWSVASVFVIPVMIREEATGNPFGILGKSAGTIKRTWGEMLAGYVGLKGANILVFLASLLLLGTGVALSFAVSSFWLLLPFGLVWLIALAGYSYLANVASQVYLCALYIYASEGVVPGPYDQDLLDAAWKVKKR